MWSETQRSFECPAAGWHRLRHQAVQIASIAEPDRWGPIIDNTQSATVRDLLYF